MYWQHYSSIVHQFFLRGTQLSQLSEEYDTCLDNINQTKKLLHQKKQILPDLRASFKEATSRFQEASKAREQRFKADELKKELAWAHVAAKQVAGLLIFSILWRCQFQSYRKWRGSLRIWPRPSAVWRESRPKFKPQRYATRFQKLCYKWTGFLSVRRSSDLLLKKLSAMRKTIPNSGISIISMLSVMNFRRKCEWIRIRLMTSEWVSSSSLECFFWRSFSERPKRNEL